MKIFIDESGPFSFKVKNKHATISCVGALIIPEDQEEEIYKWFNDFKSEWGFKGEIKSKNLDEKKFDTIIRYLAQTDCTFYASLIDMSIENESAVSRHKEVQSRQFSEKVSLLNDEVIKSDILETAKNIINLSFPNYTQSVLSTVLVDRVFRSAILYYVQRMPQILNSFSWYVDAKSDKLTSYEKIWKKVLPGFLQSASINKPHIELKGANYSYMKPYLTSEVSDYIKKEVKDQILSRTSYNLKKVLDDMYFVNSEGNLGIQLVDILIGALRRFCNGNLQSPGIINLGKLTVEREIDEHYIFDIITLSGQSLTVNRPYYGFFKNTEAICKTMMNYKLLIAIKYKRGYLIRNLKSSLKSGSFRI